MNYIKALGTSGTRTRFAGTTCLQLSPTTVIDAGNVINGLGEDAAKIEHVFLTHAHFDHICDLPVMLDLFFAQQKRTLHIYGLEATLDTLRRSIFNEEIFPDFSEIDLLHNDSKAVAFHPVELYESYEADGVTVTPFPTRHTVPSCGYIIRKENHAVMFTADTCYTEAIPKLIDAMPEITTLVTEISFPNALEQLAEDSMHFIPKTLFGMLGQIGRDDLRVAVMHLKPSMAEVIMEQIAESGGLPNGGRVLHDGAVIPYDRAPIVTVSGRETERFDMLLRTGIALSSEQNHDRLTEMILRSARELTAADGGTLYLLSDDGKSLAFKVLQNESMGVFLGGTKGEVGWPPVPLVDEAGRENHALVAAHCALTRALINIEDVYDEQRGFDFHNTRRYDEQSGYRSQSMLVVPLLDHERRLIGVLQLINKKEGGGETVPFGTSDEAIISALGSQAAVSITNRRLIEDLETLFESFLDSINLALDEKSPYTGGHIGRMVEISILLAEGIHADTEFYPDIHYTQDELKTIRLAAMMHDIGKVTTPEHIMDKATKLESINDRIENVRLRVELMKRDIEAYRHKNVKHPASLPELQQALAFLEEANLGGEFFSNEKIERVKAMAAWEFAVGEGKQLFLSEDEVKNLIVQKGTLTDEQRGIINNHAAVSLKMLNSIRFPQKYARVPEIAAAHHEKIRGGGYPLGLKGDEISFEARILAIADIFEALTASDRPYKPAKKLSESMKILWFMAKDNDIDRGICDFFYRSGLYRTFAERHLSPELIDEVDLDFTFGEEG